MPISKKIRSSKKSRVSSSKKVNKKLPKQMVFVFLGGATVMLLAAIGFGFFDFKPFCANAVSCIKDLSGTYNTSEKKAEFEGNAVAVPSMGTFAFANQGKQILGEHTGNKRIEVDLTNQHLYAYEGDSVVMDFPVSTGKWWPTPTGEFEIWVKLRYTKMEGGSRAINTYYYLPNVPYTMFFFGPNAPKGKGFAIHGAYWHNNFGNPMSHGCINMAIEDAGKVFAWANPTTTGWANPASKDDPGTKIVIYGETPKR